MVHRPLAMIAVLGACGSSGSHPASDAGGDGSMICYGSSPEDMVCLRAAPDKPVILGDGGSSGIGTDGGPLCSQQVVSGPDGCVVAGTSITVNNQVGVSGHKPLILIASGAFSVTSTGMLDVSAFNPIPAGANTGCPIGTLPPAGSGAGGAGGSFGGSGGSGGKGDASASVGMPAPTLTPTAIRGGCPGQYGDNPLNNGGQPGEGGGGVLVIANAADIAGAINASGGPGVGGGQQGGGGAGSGGMIAIDAAAITGTGVLIANGGGGGGGGDAGETGTAGFMASPSAPTTPAGGGAASPGSGQGGTGSAGTAHDGAAGANAQTTTPNSGGGGGGGGAAGVIRFYNARFTTGAVSPS